MVKQKWACRYRQQSEECSITTGVGRAGLLGSRFTSLQPEDMPGKEEDTLLVGPLAQSVNIPLMI